MTHARKLVVAWLAMMVQAPPATAGWGPNAAEMAALPPYCAARFEEGSDAFKSWKAQMGGDFLHVHHYCAGLNMLNRARGSAASGNKDMLGAVVREFDYVLTHAESGFYLRPEILMNRGLALSMLNRHGEAVGNLQKAIELDPKQPRAYAALADLYDRQKNRSLALETVTAGLRHNPEAKSLQRRYTELGGKLPFPAPLPPVQAEPARLVEPQAVKPAEPVASASASPADPAAASPAAPAAAEPVAAPKIGSPKNPYCRFCPD